MRHSSVVVLAFENGEEVEEDTMDRMDKCIASVKRNFSSIRTGRASPDMLDRVMVDYYGAPTPLRQLAGISVPESTLLVVQPYDKGAMQAIERAIQTSDLGLTPNNDGKLIRLNIPQLTAERRKDFAKQASKMAEDGKVAIRNVRRDSMKVISQLESDGLGEDEAKAFEDSIQESTDEAVKQIESLLKSKQDDLTKV